MKIARVSARPYRVPLLAGKESLSAAYSKPSSYLHAVLIEVETEDGTVGMAESPIRPYVYGDTQPGLTYVVNEVLGPLCEGMDVFAVDEIMVRMEPPNGVTSNLVAKGGIDTAIHDVIGKLTGAPVFQLLGAGSDPPPPMKLSWLLPLHQNAKILEEAKEAYENGYRAYKIKVGREPSEDIALVKSLRAELGENAVLYADANEAYDATTALRTVNAMAEHGLSWIEDPCPVTLDRLTRRHLVERLDVPVVGDASCFTPSDVRRELEDGTSTIPMIKLPRTGYRGAQRIIAVAGSFGTKCILGTQGESALGTVAAAHLPALSASFLEYSELSFFARMAQSSVTPDLQYERGNLLLAAEPGIGGRMREELFPSEKRDVVQS